MFTLFTLPGLKEKRQHKNNARNKIFDLLLCKKDSLLKIAS